VTAAPTAAIRREILAAYFASASRVLSWVIVTAVVYRRLGPDLFAILALVRTTIGLLNYTTLGLAPAMVRMLSLEKRDAETPSEVYSSAMALAALASLGGVAMALAYAVLFAVLHRLPAAEAHENFGPFVFLMGLGMVFRIVSDAPGAVLQVRARITLDNLLLAGAEWIWITLIVLDVSRGNLTLESVAGSWAVSALLLLISRALLARQTMGRAAFAAHAARGAMMRRLLSFGLLVALAQAADFLYAPTDNILINRFLDPRAVAAYAPAIQIDAGLLLLVSGLAAVLLPRTALAHAAGNTQIVRRYYIKGTLLSLCLLLPAALAAWLLSPLLFRLWLGDPMPATLAILPLVLIHTVVGGSSAVGRSVLLASGKVRPFTAAVLIAGASNVLLSFVFVHYFKLGLPGIVYGTLVAVIGRCAVWMPWYVMRELRKAA
jgi:O-antigen/teichoic acid export membrane protein